MFSLKGLYNWKLINADTGLVDKEGSQWNTINDQLHEIFVGQGSNPGNNYLSPAYNSLWRIQLSNSTTTPGVDYRRFKLIGMFTVSAESSDIVSSYDVNQQKIYVGNNFAPPGAPLTIRIIGVRYRGNAWGSADPFNVNNFESFIELSSPITQNTNQYFYVQYTLFFNYVSGGGYRSPANRYLDYRMNQTILYGTPSVFGATTPNTSSSYFGAPDVRLTPLLPPVTLNNVMRPCPCVYSSYDYIAKTGAYLSKRYSKSFSVTDIPGPLGLAAVRGYFNPYYIIGNSVYDGTFAYSNAKDNTPSISRVFAHPAARISQVFSDPSFPASSRGTVTPSGTPTNNFFIIARVRVTKTGDASNIVDETFLPAAVNTGANTITITQTLALNDIVRFTNSGGALPSPLVAGTSYYVLDASTTFRVSLTQGGSPEDIADQGTGTHTMIRYSTGKFLMEYEPWRYTIDANARYYQILNMGIDVAGKMQPHDLTGSDIGEGGSVISDANLFVNSLLKGAAPVGSYWYSVQRSRVDNLLNMCRWRLWTIETSESLCSFGTSATEVTRTVAVGTDIYMSSNVGIWKYDTTNPTVAPSLLTITSLIDSYVSDMTYDTITGFMWTGHGRGSNFTVDTGSEILTLSTSHNFPTGAAVVLTNSGGALPNPLVVTTIYYAINVAANQIRLATSYANALINSYIDITTAGTGTHTLHAAGLSKINLGALTATLYMAATGSGLQGMITADSYVTHNQMDSYNGRILRCGTGSDGPATGTNKGIAVEDGVGWYIFIGSYTGGASSCLRKGTNHILFRTRSTFDLYNVTVSGMGTGTVSSVESYSALTDSYYDPQDSMLQLSDTNFIWVGQYVSGQANYYAEYYTIGAAPIVITNVNYSQYVGRYNPLGSGSMMRNGAIDINGAGLLVPFARHYLPNLPTGSCIVPYGYDGANWIKDLATDRYIPDGAATLLNGVSVTFNNAVGQPYDQQFILGERLTFVHGPYKTKDNLQTFSLQARLYYCKSAVTELQAATVPGSAPYEYNITEISNPNFRDMDTVDYVTEVYEGVTRYTIWTLPASTTVTVDYTTDRFTGANIATGTPVTYSSSGEYARYLDSDMVYYAINISPTVFKLATTYANALAGTAIDLATNGSGTHYIYAIAPTTGTYFSGRNGVFVFAAADAGKNLTLTYTYTLFS